MGPEDPAPLPTPEEFLKRIGADPDQYSIPTARDIEAALARLADALSAADAPESHIAQEETE